MHGPRACRLAGGDHRHVDQHPPIRRWHAVRDPL